MIGDIQMIDLKNMQGEEYVKYRQSNTEELLNKIHEVNNENCMIHVFDKIGHCCSTKYLTKKFTEHESSFDFLSLGEFKYKRKYKYSFIVYNPKSYCKLFESDFDDSYHEVFYYNDDLTISKIKQQNYPEDLYKCLNDIFKDNKQYAPDTYVAFGKPWKMKALIESGNYFLSNGYIDYLILGIKILERL